MKHKLTCIYMHYLNTLEIDDILFNPSYSEISQKETELVQCNINLHTHSPRTQIHEHAIGHFHWWVSNAHVIYFCLLWACGWLSTSSARTYSLCITDGRTASGTGKYTHSHVNHFIYTHSTSYAITSAWLLWLNHWCNVKTASSGQNEAQLH